MDKKIVLGIVAVVILLVAGMLFFYGSQQPSGAQSTQAVDPSTLVAPSNNMTGKIGAKVTIVEFGDYECPACAASVPVLNTLLQKYRSNPRFNFVFRNFPLTSIHRNAFISAEAAEAAGAQGKFWEMHDALYAHQTEWAESADPIPTFTDYAKNIGLDTGKFTRDLQTHAFAKTVQSDLDTANALNLNATPTFFINGQAYVGVPNLQDFRNRIDAGLVAL